MEACATTERDCERVAKRIRTVGPESRELLEGVLQQIETMRSNLSLLPQDSRLSSEQVEALKSCVEDVSKAMSSISAKHRDIHPVISKLGRTIDKYFKNDYSVVSDEDFTGEKAIILNLVICDHLFRQGRLDVAKSLMMEANIDVSQSHIEKFVDMHKILGALKLGNTSPAMEWALENSLKLREFKSSLIFKLHRLKYISHLKNHQMKEALDYAKELQPFLSEHTKDIHRLMGCLAFCHRGLENSPYKDLLDPWMLKDVAENFTKDACMMMELGLESPLSISVAAGCIALPALLHMHGVMEQQQVSKILNHKGELPGGIDLSVEFHFHSIFSCPILRQQTSLGNPPVRLICGHAISNEAVKKLTTHTGKLKCPYCPAEMAEKEIQEIHF